MATRATMDAAHAAAVMVRVRGPDHTGRKWRAHPFSTSYGGHTTVSASGFLAVKTSGLKIGARAAVSSPTEPQQAVVPMSSTVVVTYASVIDPFLAERGAHPKLREGAQISVYLEVPECPDEEHRSQYSIPATLERMVELPAADAALHSLLDVQSGRETGDWEIGWALTPLETDSRVQRLGAAEFLPARAISVQEDEHPRQREITLEQQTLMLSPTSTQDINFGGLSMATERLAILRLSWKDVNAEKALTPLHLSAFQQACGRSESYEVAVNMQVASSFRQGDFLLAAGSPFGASSPLHFHNSVSAGVISNFWPPTMKPAALLMTDMRCLPGMEGGPAFNEEGALVGILSKPLRVRSRGVEFQLVMTSATLAPALHDVGVTLGVPILQQCFSVDSPVRVSAWSTSSRSSSAVAAQSEETSSSSNPQEAIDSSPIAKAMSSVVLVGPSNGWGSGVIISHTGLILTCAHILEPLRFSRTKFSRPVTSTTALLPRPRQASETINRAADDGPNQSGESLQSSSVDDNDDPGNLQTHGGFRFSQASFVEYCSSSTTEQVYMGRSRSSAAEHGCKVQVRLNHDGASSWHETEVIYVSDGPLDVALLRLVSPPSNLRPIMPDESCPTSGSRAVVIGHGLFGRWADELQPSVTSGVVAKVVLEQRETFNRRKGSENSGDHSWEVYPAMIQTTAAVHPGSSGGIVVDSLGRMIGLVTSNAKLGAESLIPYLNFSLPCGVLTPVFDFAFSPQGSGDVSKLTQTLDQRNDSFSELWARVPKSPPHEGPPSGKGKEGEAGPPKGSAFFKFIDKIRGLSSETTAQAEDGRPISVTTVDAHVVMGRSTIDPRLASRL